LIGKHRLEAERDIENRDSRDLVWEETKDLENLREEDYHSLFITASLYLYSTF